MNARKPKGFLSPRSYRKLLRFAGSFCDSLGREPEFSAAINANLRAFRGDLLRTIRANLQLPRGRRRDPRLDRASELLNQGKSAPEVLRCQIAGFDGYDSYTRYLLGKGLRQAAARRRNRRTSPKNGAEKSVSKLHLPPDLPKRF